MLRTIARGHPSPVWRRVVARPNGTTNAAMRIVGEGQRYWQVLSVSALANLDAGAGNRIVVLDHVDQAGVVLGRYPLGTTLTAGQDTVVTFAAGLGATVGAAASAIAAPLPSPFYVAPSEALLLDGLSVAADRWQNVRAVVIETYQGDPVFESNLEQSIMDHWRAIHELTAGV